MQATTTQVRAIVREEDAKLEISVLCTGTYTDKTSKLQPDRRTVTFPLMCRSSALRSAVEKRLRDAGYNNTVALTSSVHASRPGGFDYLRIIATIG